MKDKSARQSLLDALLYERPGLNGQWKRWKTLASLNGVDRQRVRFIADLVKSPRPAKEDILKAASLLRMLGFLEDAVRLLKKHRAIDEAGEILLVAGRAEEAARLFEKRKMWESAARCYEQAHLRTEAARCYEAIGKPMQAAALYESKHRFADAGRCYDNAGVPSAAAICYANSGQFDAAMKMFEAWAAQDNEEFLAMPLGYIDGLVLAMARTKLNQRFLSLLEARGSIADLVRELLKAGKEDDATALYRLHRDDIMDDLCKWAETDIHDGYRALKLFENAGDKKANRYLNQHFSVADVTRQKSTLLVTKASLPRAAANHAGPDPINDTANALIFSQSVFFRDFDSEARDRIWDLGSTERHLRGAIIVEFREQPKGVITVLEGEVTLYRRKGKITERVGSFHSGQTIGESWLLYALASEVRVVANSTCVIHIAKRSEVEGIQGPLPQQIAARLAKHLLERVKPGALSGSAARTA